MHKQNLTYLQGKETDAARALDEDAVAGFYGLEAVQRVPARQACARESRGLDVAEVLGRAHEAGLAEGGVLAQGAVHHAAHARTCGLDAHGAELVALIEERYYSVTLREPRHLGPDLHDLARAVRGRDDGEPRRERVLALRDDEVAVVERGGVEPDENLAVAYAGHLAVDVL